MGKGPLHKRHAFCIKNFRCFYILLPLRSAVGALYERDAQLSMLTKLLIYRPLNLL